MWRRSTAALAGAGLRVAAPRTVLQHPHCLGNWSATAAGNTAVAVYASDSLRASSSLARSSTGATFDFEARKEYMDMYHESINDSDNFWGRHAKDLLTWRTPFHTVQNHCVEEGLTSWFLGGSLNASENCLDRHLASRGDQIAFFYEADELEDSYSVTYNQLHRDVCRMANLLIRQGVKKGDRVCIYMPMTPKAATAMLACARIGAIHSVVFAGFGPDALAARIRDAGCRVVLTADEGIRGGKTVPLRNTLDAALNRCPGQVDTVIVQQRTGNESVLKPGDVLLEEALADERPFCPAQPMQSEDPLFILYTSGSTGSPKGMLHTTAGYLTHIALGHKYAFGHQEGDVFCNVADVGWITGHSYVVYAPLLNGGTSVIFESLPIYPDPGRYWSMVERYGINQLFTAPTAIRLLMKSGDEFVTKYDRSSLRVLATAGEPIGREAWEWYKHVGEGNAKVLDSWWQTETGGPMLAAQPWDEDLKPGSVMRPFFGIEPVLVDEQGNELSSRNSEGLLAMKRPHPGLARTIYGHHRLYIETYYSKSPGLYMTGDGARRDADGHFWITGRVDDVINVSGHRLGTAEVESAINSHHGVAESAVVDRPHEVKGSALFAFVIMKYDYKVHEQTADELKQTVRQHLGPVGTPDHILIVEDLPKTRSGKIMRRILRRIAAGKTDYGDTSTLADPTVIDRLEERCSQQLSL